MIKKNNALNITSAISLLVRFTVLATSSSTCDKSSWDKQVWMRLKGYLIVNDEWCNLPYFN